MLETLQEKMIKKCKCEKDSGGFFGLLLHVENAVDIKQ